MKRKVARAFVAGVLIVLVGVTPLSASFRPGYFETRFAAQGLDPGPRVVVWDETGLVRTIAVPPWKARYSVRTNRVLVIDWLGGCADQQYWLTLSRHGDRYRIAPRTVSFGCGLMIGLGRTLVLGLNAPIDPAMVEFEEIAASVR